MESILIFVNPIAGRGRASIAAASISQTLESSGYSVRTFVQSPEQIADDQLQFAGHMRAAIVIGGDGTLRAAAQRLLDCAGDSHPPPILLIPLGTANLMGRHLGLGWADQQMPQQVLDAIRRGSIRELDAASANGRLFLLMAGVGIDAHIVHLLDRLRDGPINLTSYVVPAMLALHGYDYPPLCVDVDGQRVFGPQQGVAFVGNAREYGTGFAILPHARTDDDLLDVCVIPCRSRNEVLHLFLHAAMGEHLHAEGVVYRKGRSIGISADKPAPVQIDGDAAGFTPLAIELLPVKVPFIVPPAK